MSVPEQVAYIQRLYPDAYREIRLEGAQEGARDERWFQDAARRQDKALERTKNGRKQKSWYIPFP